MIIRPKVRGFVCVTTHPTGCARNVERQIEYAQSQPRMVSPPKSVLVLGASTSYGLGSRISLAFGGGAATLGVFFDRAPNERKPGTAGWYNTAAFEQAAADQGLVSASVNGDAFSDEAKARVVEILKRDFPPVDCVVNSLASPRRTHPSSGEIFNSVLKPIGKPYRAKSLNTDKEKVIEIELDPASSEEIADTVTVMGGEDWQMWMDALADAGVLAPNCHTVAYSYVGPEITWPIYRDGTIGQAKADLRKTADALNARFALDGGGAHIAVMKAVVTQASAAIPVVPLYISILYKAMKEVGDHEGPMEQAHRLFASKMFGTEGVVTDSDGFVRLDDLEMKAVHQESVAGTWATITSKDLRDASDFDGYKRDFLRLFGFGVDGVDYEAEVEHLLPINNLTTL